MAIRLILFQNNLLNVHEMGFAQSIFEHVFKLAKEKEAKKVEKITLEMGELLLINPEQLEFCFQVASIDTIVKDAKLEIEYSKPVIACTVCGKKYDKMITYCDCGGLTSVEGGKDMIIKNIVMEV